MNRFAHCAVALRGRSFAPLGPWARVCCAVLVALSAALVAPLAQAVVTEEGPPNLMVRPFEGPKAVALQERVVRVLEDQGADLVPAGFEGPRPLVESADYAEAAARLNIQAFILGVVSSDNSGWQLTLTVRQGADGAVVGETEFTASWFPGLLTKIDEQLVPTLEQALSGAEVPEAAPEDEVDEEEEEEVEERPAPKPLDLSAGFGFVFRSFSGSEVQSFADNINMRDQSGGMANLRIGAGFYPGALLGDGFLANIGLVALLDQSLGGTTEDAQGEALDTALRVYDVGLRVRFPVRSNELGVSAMYGDHLFEIGTPSADGAPAGCANIDPTREGPCFKPVPDVSYSYVRLGADFAINRSSYFFSGDLGLRVVDSGGDGDGQIQNDEWYPRSDIGGVDAGLRGGYFLTERMTAVLGADFRNFYYNMNNREEDFGDPQAGGSVADRRPIAGGATDMYFAFTASVQYSLR